MTLTEQAVAALRELVACKDAERKAMREVLTLALSASPQPTEPNEDPPKGACPSCGNEETNSRGLWTCECPAQAVYLVPTGELHEGDGRETYTRHLTPPPLCDFEKLYTSAPTARYELAKRIDDWFEASLRAYAEAAVLAEREACEALCKQHGALNSATAIRARTAGIRAKP